jgi:hypothetical protein
MPVQDQKIGVWATERIAQHGRDVVHLDFELKLTKNPNRTEFDFWAMFARRRRQIGRSVGFSCRRRVRLFVDLRLVGVATLARGPRRERQP